MARSRNIKPGFFHNEELADCGMEGQLMFAGLWTLSDRDGRLEDRPRRIKAQIFPYNDIDSEKILNNLQKNGFINRYEIENNKYIQILNFNKHQNPHIKEAASTIPAPCLNGTSTKLAGLIPDSLNLIPDSLQKKTKGFRPPSLQEVTEYCKERNNKIDPQSFVDHYETNGWVRGKTKIKNWKACVRTWEKNTKDWPAVENKPSRPLSAVERVRLANGLDKKEIINVN